jgi:acetolactate synthase-1/2/3 large subunit
MGFALPASIGYKIGAPNDTVICICGDGGFTMSLIELLTAVENKVNIKVLVINNSCQLMVKMWQDKFYDKRQVGVKMNNPNFEDVAKSFGCTSLRIDSKDNIEEQLKYFMEYKDGPIVANVITDENELVLPMVSPGKALDDMIIDENDDKKMDGDAPC